jgi:hypothetical protein
VLIVLAAGGGRGGSGGSGGGEEGGGGGFRGTVPSVHSLGPYPFITLAVIVLVIGGYWAYLRSRR